MRGLPWYPLTRSLTFQANVFSIGLLLADHDMYFEGFGHAVSLTEGWCRTEYVLVHIVVLAVRRGFCKLLVITSSAKNVARGLKKESRVSNIYSY